MFRRKKLVVYGVYRAPQTLKPKVVSFKVAGMTKKNAKNTMYDHLFDAPEKGGLGIGHRSIVNIFTADY